MPVAERFPTCRSIFFAIKSLRLFEQKEGIAVRRAARRRPRAYVVGNKWLVGGQGVVRTCFEARLDPVEDGTEYAERREGSVEVKGDD